MELRVQEAGGGAAGAPIYRVQLCIPRTCLTAILEG